VVAWDSDPDHHSSADFLALMAQPAALAKGGRHALMAGC
jgi:hypothetical protein